MTEKAKALADLRDIFNCWKSLTARLREPELTAPVAGGWSVKDVVAHLRGWQQLSVARLEAAQWERAPALPGWLAGGDPESEPETDAYNARIHEAARAQSWREVHRAWRESFLRLLALAEATPEDVLLDTTRYPWLNGRALIDVLIGSYEHHREHLEEL